MLLGGGVLLTGWLETSIKLSDSSRPASLCTSPNDLVVCLLLQLQTCYKLSNYSTWTSFSRTPHCLQQGCRVHQSVPKFHPCPLSYVYSPQFLSLRLRGLYAYVLLGVDLDKEKAIRIAHST